MTDSVLCIACLSRDIKMYCIQNTQLSEIFENLTNTKLSNLEGISQTTCYICYSQLQKCCRFIKMSQKAGGILTQLLSDKVQITPGTVSALDERTIIKQSSIQIYETDANESLGEDAGCNSNGGSWIDLEALDIIKEEPKDIDDQMTIEDDFVAIKHEPMEAIEYFAPQACSQFKIEHDLTQNQTEVITELNTSFTTQIDNKMLALNTLSPKTYPHENNTTETKRKCTKRIRSKPPRIHQCTMCELSFGCPAYLMRHMRTHTGEKPYSCDHCGKSFTQSGHLVQHMRLHTGEKPYECHICKNKSFNHKYNYKTHMKKHFGEPTHICDLCKSAFHQKADLKRHMMSHTGEKPYACNICNVKFSQNCHLTKHKKIHMKEPYSCEFCSLTFIHKLDFNNHKTTHKRTEKFPCPYGKCTKTFNKQNTLTCHMKSHINGRPYGCLKCERTFKQKGHLTKHIILVHDKKQCEPEEKQNNLQLNEVEADKPDQEKLIENQLQERVEEYIIP